MSAAFLNPLPPHGGWNTGRYIRPGVYIAAPMAGRRRGEEEEEGKSRGALDSECENENENGGGREERIRRAYEWISRRGAAKITIGFHVPYTQARRVRMHASPNARACVSIHFHDAARKWQRVTQFPSASVLFEPRDARAPKLLLVSCCKVVSR